MNSRSIAARVLLTGGAALTVALGSYVVALLGRTEFLARSTSVGSDVIVAFHLLAVSAVVASAWAQRHMRAKHGWAIFAGACAVELAFFLLNVFGKVWHFQKGEPESLYAAAVQLIQSVFR